MATSVEHGQRWRAVVLGLPQVIRVVEPSYVCGHQWMCLIESSGETLVLDENSLEELLPNSPGGNLDRSTSSVDVPPFGL